MSADSDNHSLVNIGRLGKPFGIKGWIYFDSYTHPSDNAFNYLPWLNASQNKLIISEFKPHGNRWIVKFEEVSSPESARLLTNQELFTSRKNLPVENSDEVYWSDLIGFKIFNIEGEYIGSVIDLFETGSNDIMIINDSNNKEHYIPYIKDIINTLDKENKIMVIDWALS